MCHNHQQRQKCLGSLHLQRKNDVARLTVPVTLADEYLDALSMVFTKADNGTVLSHSLKTHFLSF